MSNQPPSSVEPRFFFLMPVWGEKHIEYLLTFGLPTLLSPNNFPSLPNRAVSQFTFITRVEDESPIRASKLFAKLEQLIPVKFIFLNLHHQDRKEKFYQLGSALKLGATEALGRGYCLFFHPDGLYSDGMVKFLYDVARSGKKACVTHGPNAGLEKTMSYLRERNLLTFDEVNPLASRVLARVLIENLHPDTAVHCMGNPHYPVDPFMGFWLSPKLDGALFRFVSLHPWMVDLSYLSEVLDFGAIDHNFIRAHGFVWSDVHVETDSDNILVIGLKPEKEHNATPNPWLTLRPADRLAQSLRKSSNCNYSRFCFFHGLRVHTADLDRDWFHFEMENLKWLNRLADASIGRANISPRYFWRLFSGTLGKFVRLAVVERRPSEALEYALHVCKKLSGMILRITYPILLPLMRFYRRFNPRPGPAPAINLKFCAVCQPTARRCVSGNMYPHDAH